MDSPLARAAAIPNSVLLVTSRVAHESRKSYLFVNPEHTFTLLSLETLPTLFHMIDSAAAQGLYAAGYFQYECGYAIEPRLRPIAPIERVSAPLAWFGFYKQPMIFDYTPEVQPNLEAPVLHLEVSEDEYFQKFEKIKSHIAAGNTYQVNLTTRLKWKNNVNPAALFSHLMSVQPVEFGAFINLNNVHILSVSPELFFRRHGDRIITRPMKGTSPRGFSINEQRLNSQWLANDLKNRSENVMIVDLLRNDLRRVCTVNSVNVDELFAIETYPTLLQMTSTVSGQLRPGVSYADIFRCLFPCGSITGAPKVRTMEIIRDIEDHPRGVYTGTIGFISPCEEAVFSVAIRTITLKEGQGEMGIGGGIVWDSDPVEEFKECQLKGSFLSRSAAMFDLIETILWDQEFTFFSEHLSRLSTSAMYFGFPFHREDVEFQLQAAVKGLSSMTSQNVRLVLSSDGSVAVSTHQASLERCGLIVIVSTLRTDSDDLFLRHKTTRRPQYDAGLEEAKSKGYDEAIFFNKEGHLTEGALHSIFVVKDGNWSTPPLADGVLPGLLRSSLLERHPRVSEQTLKMEDLVSADQVYLGSSLRGLRQISRIDSFEGSKESVLWQCHSQHCSPHWNREDAQQ